MSGLTDAEKHRPELPHNLVRRNSSAATSEFGEADGPKRGRERRGENKSCTVPFSRPPSRSVPPLAFLALSAPAM